MTAEKGVRIGANCWGQHTSWPQLLEAGIHADQVGYDTLWAWDHLYPILGDGHGPIYEGWMTITAWAAMTDRVRIGLLVGANPYRQPTLVAKMATTLDHISAGRAMLGIGAAWNVEEAEAFGIRFGSGPGERLRWLGEALPLMRGMLDSEEPSASGLRYLAANVRNEPPPIQHHIPILIGGGGERVTLRLVARHADMNNIGGGIDRVIAKEQVLLDHCRDVGRDPDEIERTVSVGTVFIRDRADEAHKLATATFEQDRTAPWYPHAGTPQQIAEELALYLDIGYRHLIANFPAPHDHESMTRFATEVRPLLEQA
jgi:alkanesulfonate monooxygenase SsuD/methylene tetrahydromethanopterin reductase-like flavin-dependent oxidoreductase (luciferase family)